MDPINDFKVFDEQQDKKDTADLFEFVSQNLHSITAKVKEE